MSETSQGSNPGESHTDACADTEKTDHNNSGFIIPSNAEQNSSQNADGVLTSESELSDILSRDASTDTLTTADSPVNAIISDGEDDGENSKELYEDPSEAQNGLYLEKMDPGPCMNKGVNGGISREIINKTESSITVFEGFIADGWPITTSEVKALEVLEQQLKYGGGFCEEMKRIDLSTPPNVYLDIDQVISLLSHKTNTSAVKKVEKFVLPNIRVLESGDMIKKLLEDFCQSLGGSTTIDELSIHCDQVSDKFIANDLKWIKR